MAELRARVRGEEVPPKPYGTAFLQQELEVWRPQLTLWHVVGTYAVLAAVLFGLGAPAASSGANAARQTVRYDDQCAGRAVCEVDVVLEQDMAAPVFVAYRLTNFFQNHRRYVKSRSDPQLNGDSVDEGDLEDCSPLIRYGDGYGGGNSSLDELLLYPCGLFANSLFTDAFEDARLVPAGGAAPRSLVSTGEWTERGIAWSTDVGKKFNPRAPLPAGSTRESPRGFMLPDVDNEHFVVWMRAAAESTFSKLYARLPRTDLRRGDTLRLRVANNYGTDFFGGGTKSIVLVESSWIGSQDPVLGPLMLAYACVCLLLAAAFFVRAQQLKSRGGLRRGVFDPEANRQTPSVLEDSM